MRFADLTGPVHLNCDRVIPRPDPPAIAIPRVTQAVSQLAGDHGGIARNIVHPKTDDVLVGTCQPPGQPFGTEEDVLPDNGIGRRVVSRIDDQRVGQGEVSRVNPRFKRNKAQARRAETGKENDGFVSWGIVNGPIASIHLILKFRKPWRTTMRNNLKRVRPWAS